MTLVLLIAFVEIWLLQLTRKDGWRSALIGAALLWSLLLLALSEVLSLAHALSRGPIFCAWAAVAIALVYPLWKSWPSIQERAADCDPRKWLLDPYFACLLISLGITLLVALVAPPNTVDSMTYHLGRVAMWLDQRSLAHFATHVERQVALSPFAEIVVANLQALSGGDRFANLVQWSSFGLTAVAASLLVRDIGGDLRAQKLAAVLVTTTPMAILQATSTQTDLVCAFFVTAAAQECVSMKGDLRSGLDLGLAAGLAMLTKGTAPVFLAPFAIWAALRLIRLHRPRRAITLAVLAGTCALAVNTPHWLRNQRVYQSPVGPAWIAQMVGNDIHGAGAIYSNLVRNTASHILLPSDRLRTSLVTSVAFLHRLVGLDANDPRTTAYGEFTAAPLTTHEDASANSVLCVLFLAAGLLLLLRGPSRSRWFWLTAFAGLVLYGAAFKWQPWGTRLHLPFFALAVVPVALALPSAGSGRLPKVVPLALLVLSLPWLIANDTRSLVPKRFIPWMLRATDIWTKPRDEQYFAGSPEDYRRFVTLYEHLRKSGCMTVGMLGDEASWTYPLLIFGQRENAASTPHPVLVRNPTARLAQPGAAPCALVSLAFGRVQEPNNTQLGHFSLAWNDGSLALYLRDAPALAPTAQAVH